jgi:hypothetical protein
VSNAFLDSWQHHVVDVDAGELAYIVFPGPPPFMGASKLDGRSIAPVEAQRLLAAAGHEHAELGCIGDENAH